MFLSGIVPPTRDKLLNLKKKYVVTEMKKIHLLPSDTKKAKAKAKKRMALNLNLDTGSKPS